MPKEGSTWANGAVARALGSQDKRPVTGAAWTGLPSKPSRMIDKLKHSKYERPILSKDKTAIIKHDRRLEDIGHTFNFPI